MEHEYYQNRRTVETSFHVEGVGLHTGEACSLRVEPAESGEGLRFQRDDLDPPVEFEATSRSVVEGQARATVLESQGQTLHTVEHLMAALYGLGVTDATLTVSGPEIPAMDGSASDFVELLQQAGLKAYSDKRHLHRVKEPLYVNDGSSLLFLLPSTDLEITCTISYDNPAIGDQFFDFQMNPEFFAREIAPARTFGMKEEVEQLHERGLAQGGSLENALVMDEEGVFLGDEPQFEDEFVRHKILDIIGDIALIPSFIVGRVVAVKNSHALNARMVQELSEKVQDPVTRLHGKLEDPGGEMADIERIKEILPHRYPFLLVDRILSLDHDKEKAVGLKNVTINEPFFQGHFPDDAVMPGVLILEAIAQLGGVWVLSHPKTEGKNSYFMGLDDVKWRRPVRPGDQLILEVETGERGRIRSRMGMMEGRAYVHGELAAEGVFKYAIVDH